MDKDFLTKAGLLMSLLVVLIAGKIAYSKLRVQAFNKYGEAIALELTDLQFQYYSDHKRYQSDFKKLKSINLDEKNPAVTVYYDTASIPEEYVSLIEKVGPPFMTSEDYRLLVGVKNIHDQRIYFWIVNPNQNPVLVATDMTFKPED